MTEEPRGMLVGIGADAGSAGSGEASEDGGC